MKIGLVFAGGGGKGSYQIGVWKAFREFGLDEKVVAVAGTSVGAINAALFMQGDFQKAEDAWLRISPGKILSLSAKKIFNAFLSWGIKLPGKSILFINQLCDHGFFSRSGLLELINESLILSSVSDSPIKGYGACLQTPPNMKINYFTFNNASPNRIISILLASSAIPAIFRPIEIDGHRYIDGGLPIVGDNIPIQPLYDHGCDYIFVVHLSRNAVVDKERFPNATILEIVPPEHLGYLFSGLLNFSAEDAVERIERGYADTVSILKLSLKMYETQRKFAEQIINLENDEKRAGMNYEKTIADRIQLKLSTVKKLERIPYGISKD